MTESGTSGRPYRTAVWRPGTPVAPRRGPNGRGVAWVDRDRARHRGRRMSERNKRMALTAAILGSFVAGLDATVVNVALPAIESDLGGGLAGQQWVSNAYLLTLGSLILVGGSL